MTRELTTENAYAYIACTNDYLLLIYKMAIARVFWVRIWYWHYYEMVDTSTMYAWLSYEYVIWMLQNDKPTFFSLFLRTRNQKKHHHLPIHTAMFHLITSRRTETLAFREAECIVIYTIIIIMAYTYRCICLGHMNRGRCRWCSSTVKLDEPRMNQVHDDVHICQE